MKLCECGCGGVAPIAQQTEKARGYIKGQPRRFISGHASANRKGRPTTATMLGEQSDQLCECGCGEKVDLAMITIGKFGHQKGEPLRFRANHHYTHTPVKELFEQYFEPVTESGCWLWTSTLNVKGYGQFNGRRQGVSNAAHRAAYEIYRGPIPEGFEIDHLCRVRSCVNPNHLEAVTHAVNLQRGRDARKARAPF